ncbi:hypothetical protein GCM10010918_49420 [Paenibacillus radicis (ex Gao et al. 2016)]|uniref:Glycosyltransferase 2-like domain-containing protein n=2 Tax=Paenibacillus radicis (ex Gao et al. 2016) TaxID=1737354 RepID=A0A917HNK5_9BACL|nr:hypothetical protein GCM10010918_49420 [Paenibacillus radicis (ex Gao et al. 2016)]
MDHPLGKLPISLCMIVRDEEELLAQCLRSALPYISEIVVVDTGSVDGTAAIAAQFGAKLIQTEWIDDFAAVRNVALAHAVHPWLLVLDADEGLEPLAMEQWHRLLHDETRQGYYVQLVSSIGSAAIDVLQDRAGPMNVVKDLVCRLFRNDPRIRFTGAIHEESVTAIESAFGANAIGLAPIVVLHEGYREERLRQRGKRERNARIIEAALDRNPGDPMLRYARGTEFFTYGEWESAAAWLEPLAAQLPQDCGYASDVFLKLSHALRVSGRLQDAEHWAEKGWRVFGYADFPDLYEAQAAALLEQDRSEEAKQAYDRALAVGPAPIHYTSAPGAGTYRTLCSAGFAAERQYGWWEAADCYKEALRIDPGYSPAWERLIMLGALNEQFRPHWKEAIEWLLHRRLREEQQLGREQGTFDSGESGLGIEEWLWRFADAGLELDADISLLVIDQLGDRAAFWHGLLLVQQGDTEAGRGHWVQYAQQLVDEPKRRQIEAYLAALRLRNDRESDQAGTAEHAGDAQRAASAAGLAPAAFARTLLHVRAWPAWQALLAAAPAHEAAAAHSLPPLQWCALLGAKASAPGSAYAAQLLRAAAPVPAAPALLAAGAVAAAAGDWPAAAERFAAARASGPRPWLARAAGSGLAAAYAAYARRAAIPSLSGEAGIAPPSAPRLKAYANEQLAAALAPLTCPSPLISERELLLRISSALYSL